jgi:hypothetical protein
MDSLFLRERVRVREYDKGARCLERREEREFRYNRRME